MNDPPPPPSSSSTSHTNTPTTSPSPSPRKFLQNHQAGSPSSSVGTDSKSATPRAFTRRSSKQYLRGSVTSFNKSPGVIPLLDNTTGDSSHAAANTLPNTSLHATKEERVHCNPNEIIPDPQNPKHRQALPRPLSPEKCPLLCVFYAEFDIVVGPMVCFQSPSKFMFFDINVGPNEINQSLEETFQSVMQNAVPNQPPTNDTKVDESNNLIKIDPDDYWNWSEALELVHPLSTKNDKNNDTDLSSQLTLPASGKRSHRRRNTDGICAEQLTASAIARSPSFASSKGASFHEDSTVDSEILQNSIFTATSEYIITGNELANRTITVSTHGMHILSRPMIISDTKRYERNSLLFSVGFVLRRNNDPSPYWPVLSNLSSTFRSMEVESEFLSHQRTRPMIQTVLEDVLISLNSKQRDCHLLLDEANLLSLQLFQPPPPLATRPVPDYAVPILLKPEFQLQMFDWDLTINWILPHIDGSKHVKQIAQSSEVDMDLVRSCLRVLRHHGVLSFVDVFRYSNLYECTPLAMKLLFPVVEGEESKDGSRLLDEAFWYAIKRKFARQAPTKMYHRERLGTANSGNSPSSFSTSPIMNYLMSRRYSQHSDGDFEPRSLPSRTRITEEPNSDEDAHSSTSSPRRMNSCGSAPKSANLMKQNTFFRDTEIMKKTLAALYCACSRESTFGDILMSKVVDSSNQSKGETNEMHNASIHSLDSAMAPLYKSPDFEADDITANNYAGSAPKEKSPKVNDSIEADWTRVFQFDHRRLLSFGVAHGLIKRVHQYPLAYEVHQNVCQTDDDVVLDRSKSYLSHDFDATSMSQLEFSAELFDDQYRSSSEVVADAAKDADAIMDEVTSVITPTLSHSSRHINEVGIDSPGHAPRRSVSFAERVASAMDGTRCDDELSCLFSAPVEDLIEMLQNSGRWSVVSLFSSESYS